MNSSVAIIVPVYNQERYLEKCIDSVLNQTYENFECILVDDGSTDKSPKICDDYAKKHKKIKLVHKENGGLTSARRAGFEVASAEYVCFLDSDDYLSPKFMEVCMKSILENDADVCTCGHYQDENGRIIRDTFRFKNIIIEEDITRDYVLPIIGKIYAEGYINYPGYVWGRIYRKSCVSDECFVSEREVYTEDDLFQLYLSRNIKKAVFISDKLVYYRVNTASLTHAYRKNMWKMLKERHRRVREFFKISSKEIDERISASAFYTIYVTLRNAYELSEKENFYREIKEMLDDSFSKEILKKIDKKLLRPRQKLMVILLKYRCLFFLYRSKNILFK